MTERQPRIFVGRSREVERLAALADVTAVGQTAAAIVSSEPGFGKTRLLDEVATGLALPVIDVLSYESAREIPLAAAGALLRALARVPNEGERLGAILRGESHGSAGLEALRLFEACFRCLVELGPLALVADDVQWADSETLALLRYLLAAAEAESIPLLLLCAGRPSIDVTAFAADLGRLVARERFAEVSLGPLSQAAAIELIAATAPQREAEAEHLWQLSGGSPFWLDALVAAERGEASTAELVRARLAGLDVDASGLFALLVVVAQPIAFVDAARLVGWPQSRVERAASVLANRALVVQEYGGVRIAHDLIREAARRELPDEEQRRLHQLLGSWLEEDSGDDVRRLFAALEHRQAAGAESAALALRIAGSPQRRLLGGAGLLTLGAIADATEGADGDALQLMVATLATELGEWDSALARWGALASRLPSSDARVDAALAAAVAAFRLGRASDVHAFAAQARASCDDIPTAAIEADIHDAEAFLWLENRVSDAEPLLDRAAEAAKLLVDSAGGVSELDDGKRSAYVRASRGTLDAAIRSADAATVARCVELIQAAARDPAEALAAASDGVFSLLQFEGLPRPAEPRAQRILEQAQRLALPSLEVEAWHWVGWIAQHLGRLDEAASALEQAVALAGRVGPPRRFTIAQLRAVARSIDASRRDWRANVAAIEAAIAAEPDPHFRLVIRHLHIWLVGRFAAPSDEELDALVRPMAVDAEAAGCARCYWEFVLHAAEAQARAGDAARAVEALGRWEAAHPTPHGGPHARQVYARALVEMHRDPEKSLPLFEEAASLASAVGYELVRLWIEIDAGSSMARVDRARGVEALREAARKAEAIGAVSEQRLALQQLRSLGVRTWRRRGPATPLTPRELEIAHLVAAGDSNPEIAAALFLSRKTVERHVSNILTKLGAKNRTDLAGKLPRHSADEGAAG